LVDQLEIDPSTICQLDALRVELTGAFAALILTLFAEPVPWLFYYGSVDPWAFVAFHFSVLLEGLQFSLIG